MDYELVKEFEGKFVKLVRENDFVLYGTVLKVLKDAILFKTDQASSAIPISVIKEIIEKR